MPLLKPTEILHIDTKSSSAFFKKLGLSLAEKVNCQALLKSTISECCQKFDGRLAGNWAGDGGHALFDASARSGSSVHAAHDFLKNIEKFRQQTISVLGRKIASDAVDWQFRIKAHVCDLYDSGDDGVAAGEGLDDFLKHEREFAPTANELFITEQLCLRLEGVLRDSFVLYKKAFKAGNLETSLWRFTPPIDEPLIVFEPKGEADPPMREEWNLAVKLLQQSAQNSVAQYTIPVELMRSLWDADSDGVLTAKNIREATLTALASYLLATNPYRQFQLKIWSARGEGDVKDLILVGAHPGEVNDPPIKTSEICYLCRAFRDREAVACPSIPSARILGNWVDFQGCKPLDELGFHSALRVPIFWPEKRHRDMTFYQNLGVLGIDADQNDFFKVERLGKWNQELVGYLAWLALADNIERRRESASQNHD